MAGLGGGEAAAVAVGDDGQAGPGRYPPRGGGEVRHPSAGPPTDCSCDAPPSHDVCTAF